MEAIEQEETLAEKRKRLSLEEDTLKVEALDIEGSAKSVGARLESLTMLVMKMQDQADELESRYDKIKSRLEEISDELDLINENGN